MKMFDKIISVMSIRPDFRVWAKKDKKIYTRFGWLNFKDECFSAYNHEVRHYVKVDFKDAIFMRSTGLHDRKGKKIFEGDIVRRFFKGDNPVLMFIWFDPEEQRFEALQDANPHRREIWGLKRISEKHIEVVGNIYQHPKLVEEMRRNYE